MLRRTLSSGMADLETGDGPRQQALDELLARVRPRRPAIVERREAGGVRSDNVHRPIVRGGARMLEGED